MNRSLFPLLAAVLLLAGCQTLPPVVQDAIPPATAPLPARNAGEAACPDALKPAVLVTGFPLRRPEQLPYGSFTGWPQATAETLAQALAQGNRLRPLAVPNRFPFVSPDAAPDLERTGKQAALAGWASQAGAEFAIAGVFSDFSVVQNRLMIPERHVVVDAFLFDGRDGRLLERRAFAWKLPLSWELPREIQPGSREFAATRFGQLYNALIDDIARWAEERIGCPAERIARPRPRSAEPEPARR